MDNNKIVPDPCNDDCCEDEWEESEEVKMFKITITEDSLSNIINEYCSCGGRGPEDNPCDACAIWHDILVFKNASQLDDAADEGKSERGG